MSLNPRFRRSDSVETSPVGDRVVLYDGRSRKAIVLNPTGAWLWQQLSHTHTVDELSQQLQTRFPATDAAQIRADVENCLQDLVRQELLQTEA
jgi:sensor domain CHASE-containing protein